jgi:hypothetical protein
MEVHSHLRAGPSAGAQRLGSFPDSGREPGP